MLSIGDIATALGVQSYQVAYAIESRNITEVARLGGIRGFDDSVVELVRDALAEIAARKPQTPQMASG